MVNLLGHGPTGLPAKILKLSMGNLVYLSAQFILFVVLAQMVAPSEVGKFSWALAIASPVFILADMRTRQVQLSTPISVYPGSVFWRQRLLLSALSAVGLGSVGSFISADSETYYILLGVIGLKVVEGMIGIPFGELVRAERLETVGRLQVVRSLAYLLPFVAVLVVTDRVDLALGASSLALVIPLWIAQRSLTPTKNRVANPWAAVWRLSVESFPIGLGFFVGSLTVNAPRIVLEAQRGTAELAAFTAVSYIVIVLNQLVDTINQGVMPRMSGHWRAGETRPLLRLLRYAAVAILVVGAVGTVGALVLGDWVMALVFGSFYRDTGGVMAAMLGAAVLTHLAQAFRNLLIAGGFRLGVLPISLANFAVSFSVALVLIPSYGGIGIASGLAAGQVVSLAIYGILTVRAIGRLRQRSS